MTNAIFFIPSATDKNCKAILLSYNEHNKETTAQDLRLQLICVEIHKQFVRMLKLSYLLYDV